MTSVKRHLTTLSIVAAFAMQGAAAVCVADETKAAASASAAPGEEHIMMDHSRGDSKSMSMMKDKTIPIHHSGDAPKPADPTRCKDHIMMDHSRGDTKSMSMMKDKTVPIHNPCHAPAKSTDAGAPVDHIMMDHSRGDPKSMSKMKDKTIPIHHGGPVPSGSVDKPAADSSPN